MNRPPVLVCFAIAIGVVLTASVHAIAIDRDLGTGLARAVLGLFGVFALIRLERDR